MAKAASGSCHVLSGLDFLAFHRIAKDIGLYELVALGGAFLHADATRGALRVVRHRDAVDHRDALLGAGADAGFALDASNLAALDDG